LEQFLASVERRAYRTAEIATGNADDALDILQDAMYKLVEKYSGRPAEEWGPLFQTVLQNRIMDYYRRNTVRNKYISWFSGIKDEDGLDPIQTAVDVNARSPEQQLEQDASMEVLDEAIRELPARQRQAFMLRALEGLDVAETAKAMKCSAGSVKTHYFRALSNLREKLSDYKL
jgi:RNA polymerase sigma-70 factor, ECF subfamily